MARGSAAIGVCGGRGDIETKSGAFFFMATLLMWGISVLFEILFNGRTELAPIFIVFICFQSANVVVRNFVSREPLFVNTFISLLHSSITSASGQLLNRAACGWIPSTLVHHFVLLLYFTLALYRNVTINYLILTLVCELHSIFLHVRKVRRMAGVRDGRNKFVKAEWGLNWMTFIFARLLTHFLITVKLIRDTYKFGKGVELPLALFGMAGMNLVNIFLGFNLFKAHRREQIPHSHHQ